MESSSKALCFGMCPEKEVKWRERERLLHRLEIVTGSQKSNPKADLNKVVKCYTRSAADTTVSSPNNLRPFQFLCKAVIHLLRNTINDECVSMVERYNFIDDRFRAVRQDMTVQELGPRQTVVLLEPMIKFNVYFGYMFCGYPRTSYDPFLNTKHLMECLKQVLVCYDQLEDIDQILTDDMNSLDIFEKSDIDKPIDLKQIRLNRPFFEALYILLNLGNSNPLERFLNIPKQYKSQLGKDAFTISLAYSKRYYSQAVKLIRKLPSFLGLCAVVPQIPYLQKTALAIMSHAYNSKTLTFPKKHLAKILLFNTTVELDESCHNYGISKTVETVRFNKSTFDYNAKPMSPLKINFVDVLFHQNSIEDILLTQCVITFLYAQ